jgi:polyisoprenoid-binding protein YceI
MTIRRSVLAVLLVVVVGRVQGSPTEFDCKDPKGVHNIAFFVDSTLEPIMGLASGIEGTVTFDPQEPKSTSGHIVVQAKSLHIANAGMKMTLHNADWLDVERYPTIEFKFSKVKKAKTSGKDRYELSVDGVFTCKGVTKTIPVTVVLTYLPGQYGARMHGGKGDLIVLRSEFSIQRKDYNIKPDMGGMVVGEQIDLRVAIVGLAPKR